MKMRRNRTRDKNYEQRQMMLEEDILGRHQHQLSTNTRQIHKRKILKREQTTVYHTLFILNSRIHVFRQK